MIDIENPFSLTPFSVEDLNGILDEEGIEGIKTRYRSWFRMNSQAFHPDTAGKPGEETFKSVRNGYEMIKGAPKTQIERWISTHVDAKMVADYERLLDSAADEIETLQAQLSQTRAGGHGAGSGRAEATAGDPSIVRELELQVGNLEDILRKLRDERDNYESELTKSDTERSNALGAQKLAYEIQLKESIQELHTANALVHRLTKQLSALDGEKETLDQRLQEARNQLTSANSTFQLTILHLGAQLEAALKNEPQTTYNEGLELQRTGKGREARAAFRKVVVMDPKHTDALYHLATSLDADGHRKSSRETYRKLIKIEPQNIDARYKLARSLHKDGKRKSAREQYRKIVELDPNHTDALYRLAASYLMDEQERNARAMFRKLLEVDPSYGQAAAMLGEISNG